MKVKSLIATVATLIVLSAPICAMQLSTYLTIKQNVKSPLMLAITTTDPVRASTKIQEVLTYLKSNNLNQGNICPLVNASGIDCDLEEYYNVLDSQRKLLIEVSNNDNLIAKTNVMLLVNQNLQITNSSQNKSNHSVKIPDNLDTALQYGWRNVFWGNILNLVGGILTIGGMIILLFIFWAIVIEP